mgnify:CR=1 FL=1
MPAPYSRDLREKALRAVQSGRSITSISQLFGISRSTLSQWYQRYQQHGEMAAKAHYQRGHSHKICDWDEFRTFVQQHGDKTQ